MVSVSTPPRIGPIAVLIAAAIAHAAVALARSIGLGNAAAVMARPCGSISAAPTPCTARAASSNGNDGAAAHASEATMNDHQADAQQPASAEPVTERPGSQQYGGEGDVVGVDRPLRPGDSAAEVVADGGQREVDRVGVDESDEESQVGRDQGQRRVEA